MIIRALAKGWGAANVFQELKKHLVVFKSWVSTAVLIFLMVVVLKVLLKVFPEIYNWTTYPLCVLLDKIWHSEWAAIQAGKQPNPYMVELCAVIEHLLAYGHTGNAKVISQGLMKPLWVSRSILELGMPCFLPIIDIGPPPSSLIHLDIGKWPVNKQTRYPEIASKRSQLINYGDQHYHVSILFHTVV